MTHPARWVAVALGSVVVALAVVFALQVDNDPSLESGKLLGEPAPTFAGDALGGGEVNSADVAGRVVLVNFWNDWCIPCREETPALLSFYEAHRDDPDFAMVGITRDVRSQQALRDYVAEHGIEWPVLLDTNGKAAVDFATTGQPESFMIAADGRVVGFQAGAAASSDLETMLAAARAAGVPE